MLRITAELIPGGVGKPRVLGVCDITNTGQGTASRGQYRYRLFGKSDHLIAEGTIQNFPRKRLLAWDLLKRVLIHARGTAAEADSVGSRWVTQ